MNLQINFGTCRGFTRKGLQKIFEDKKKKRRWNNDLRELGAPRPSEHLWVMYGGAKRPADYGRRIIREDGQYALLY